MATVDSLSVRVTGDSDSFNRAISSAERSLSGLNPDVVETAAALQVLQGRADEAGDEIAGIAPRATTASAGLGGLGISATGTSGAFSGLATVTLVSLVPALVTLSAALTPLVAALGGFVAIGAAIGGIGIIGALAAIKTNTETLKEEFMGMVSTLQDAFAPVIRTATAVLEIWIGEFEDIIPLLVPTASEISQLGGSFANLGEEIIELLPAIVDLGVSLATEFLPPFVDFVRNVGPQIPGIVRNLVSVFRRLIPEFQALGRFLTRFLPEFLEFGFTALNVVGPALGTLGSALTDTIQAVNNLDQGFAQLIAGGSLILPVLAGLATLLGGPITAAIAVASGAIIGLSRIWNNNILDIQQRVQSIKQEIVEWATTVVDVFSTQLQPLISDFNQLLADNQEEFSIIADGVQAVIEGIINFATAAVRIMGPVLGTLIIPLLRGVVDILDFAITKLAQFIELAGAISSGNIQEAIDAGAEFALGTEEPNLNVQIPNQQDRQTLQNQIEVQVTGDTGVIEDVAVNASERQIQNRERRANRNTNTSYNPS